MNGRSPMCRVLIISLLTVMASALMIGHGPSLTDDASGADLAFHSLAVSLFPGELTAKTTEDQLGAVTFGGNVTVEKPQVNRQVTVTLTASIDNGWPLGLSPQSVMFTNPGTHKFSTTVIVPPGTLADAKGAVTVIATAESRIWNEEASAIATVKVGQYVKANVTLLDGDKQTIDEGGTLIGKILINNTGNGQDTLIINISSGRNLLSSWDLPDPVMIPPGQYAEVTFDLTLKDDLDVGVGEDAIRIIVLKVISMQAQGQGGLYSKTITLSVHIMTFQGKIVENWWRYSLWGVGIGAAIGVPVYLWKRFRPGSKELEPHIPTGTLLPEKDPVAGALFSRDV